MLSDLITSNGENYSIAFGERVYGFKADAKALPLADKCAFQYEQALHNLKLALARAARQITQAQEALEKDYMVNRRGVLQDTGREVDEFAALVGERAEMLISVLYTTCDATQEI